MIGRLLASALLVAYWAFLTLYGELRFDLPAVLERDGALVIGVLALVLSVAVGFYVARWWVLLAVLTPVVVLGVIEIGGYGDSENLRLSEYLWWPLLWGLTWFYVAPLLLGIVVRRGRGKLSLRSERTYRGRPAGSGVRL